MKRIIRTYQDAMNAASNGEKLPKPRGPLKRIAQATGHVAGRSFLREEAAAHDALTQEMRHRYEAARATAKGVVNDVAQTIIAAREGADMPYKSTRMDSDTVNPRDMWIGTAVVAGDSTEGRALPSAREMRSPAYFVFGGQEVEVRGIFMTVNHSPQDGTTASISFNPQSGEKLPDAYKRRTDPDEAPPEPKKVFGSEIRLDIDAEGAITMMRSNNMGSGFGTDNEVTFENQTLASESLAHTLAQVRSLVAPTV